jgi:VirK protein
MLNRFPIVLVAVGTAFSLAAGLANAKAEAANPYQQLRMQLFSGVPTTAIFSPSQCQNGQQAQTKAPVPIVSGGFAIRDFMEVNGNTIAFADQHFTVQPDGSSVLELIQYRVTQNDSATVTVRSLSPTTYQPVAEPRVFQCVLGDGLRFAYTSRERD